MPAGIPFPIELTEEILNICSDDTLISAACVNSRYHNIATRLLYRYVEIDISYQKALRLLKTLSSNPTLAGHVRSLSFPDPLKGINTIETPLIAFNALLRRCFSNLHNLDRLEFNLERYSPSIFQESTFRLDSVILYFGKDSPPLTWLEVQSDLTMLTVFQLPSHGEGAIRSFSIFSPTALPKLVDVRATGQNAVELATGRPVVSVTLMCPGEDGRSLAKGTLPLLGQVAPRLEVLKFTLREVDVLDMLTALAMHFPNIVEIQFSAFLYTYGQLDDEGVEPWWPVLSKLESLKMVKLGPPSLALRYDYTTWIRNYPSLVEIDLPTGESYYKSSDGEWIAEDVT